MKIKVLESKTDKIEFVLQDAYPSLANAIRRTILKEVPSMAVETVDFYENSSSMFDEYIAHRIGLVPLTTPKTYKTPQECCGGKCAKCSTILTIEKKGPGVLYAKDMKAKDSKVKAADPEAPLIKLGKDQFIRAEATAVLGTGREHAKWSPATVGYRYLFSVKSVKDLENPEEVANSCPKKALVVKGKKVSTKDDTSCNGCGECLKIAKPKNALKLEEDTKNFLFKVEGNGSIKPGEIILEAVSILNEKTKDFEKQLAKIK